VEFLNDRFIDYALENILSQYIGRESLNFSLQKELSSLDYSSKKALKQSRGLKIDEPKKKRKKKSPKFNG
jgi:hypothetical protein